jgi:hypothetical protein
VLTARTIIQRHTSITHNWTLLRKTGTSEKHTVYSTVQVFTRGVWTDENLGMSKSSGSLDFPHSLFTTQKLKFLCSITVGEAP